MIYGLALLGDRPWFKPLLDAAKLLANGFPLKGCGPRAR
jgi:hypothetical protein